MTSLIALASGQCIEDRMLEFPGIAVKLIPPYGLVKPLAEALEVSKDRARFYIKEHEVLELPDGVVCVSNQFTKNRIEKLIKIAEGSLGYRIE